MKVRLPQNRKNVLQQPLCSEEDEEVTFMLDESAVGLSVEQDFSYTWRDLILYNLSVGAKQEELEYVYEKGLKAVPTFGVIPCTATFGTEPYSEQPLMPTKKIEGLRSDGTLHMDHKLVIHKPISKEGKLHLEDHLLDYVREELPAAYDEALEDITIYDLLTMQAGSTG